MKLAISISGNSLQSPFDSRFGRAPAFCVVDADTGDWAIHPNPAISASGGAGVQAAQFVAQLGVQAVVSGSYGPNAYDTLAAANIQMYLAPGGQNNNAEEILAMYKASQLTRADAASHAGHHAGRGGGRGRGQR